MGMAGKAEGGAKAKGAKAQGGNMGGAASCGQVTITLNTQDAQNLLLALTSALGGGDVKKKKKKKNIPEPPFGK